MSQYLCNTFNWITPCITLRFYLPTKSLCSGNSAGCSFVNNFAVKFQIEARGKLLISLRMFKVHRTFKISRTLSSTAWHWTLTMLRCSEIVAHCSIGLMLPFISTSYSGPIVNKNKCPRSISSVNVLILYSNFPFIEYVPQKKVQE